MRRYNFTVKLLYLVFIIGIETYYGHCYYLKSYNRVRSQTDTMELSRKYPSRTSTYFANKQLAPSYPNIQTYKSTNIFHTKIEGQTTDAPHKQHKQIRERRQKIASLDRNLKELPKNLNNSQYHRFYKPLSRLDNKSLYNQVHDTIPPNQPYTKIIKSLYVKISSPKYTAPVKKHSSTYNSYIKLKSLPSSTAQSSQNMIYSLTNNILHNTTYNSSNRSYMSRNNTLHNTVYNSLNRPYSQTSKTTQNSTYGITRNSLNRKHNKKIMSSYRKPYNATQTPLNGLNSKKILPKYRPSGRKNNSTLIQPNKTKNSTLSPSTNTTNNPFYNSPNNQSSNRSCNIYQCIFNRKDRPMSNSSCKQKMKISRTNNSIFKTTDRPLNNSSYKEKMKPTTKLPNTTTCNSQCTRLIGPLYCPPCSKSINPTKRPLSTTTKKYSPIRKTKKTCKSKTSNSSPSTIPPCRPENVTPNYHTQQNLYTIFNYFQVQSPSCQSCGQPEIETFNLRPIINSSIKIVKPFIPYIHIPTIPPQTFPWE